MGGGSGAPVVVWIQNHLEYLIHIPKQKKFDPICEYIKYWIPELSKVSNSELLNGEISNLEKNNYSRPIVNHNIQQRLFKSLYAEI